MGIETALQEAGEKGITILAEIDSAREIEGPASFMIEDPDGNPILIDQHI